MTGHGGFSSLDMGFRISYLIIGAAVLAYYLWVMHYLPFADWTWEQRATLLLLIGLACHNSNAIIMLLLCYFYAIAASILILF